MKSIRLAYLVSRYPQISMTFILREVRMLRELGFDIRVASINPPDHLPGQLTAIEQEEVDRTYYIKLQGLLSILRDHILTLFRQPWAYVRGLLFAIKIGKWDLKKNLYGFFYFVEAIVIGAWMYRQHAQHLHIHLGTAASTVGLIVHRTFGYQFSITIHGPQDFYEVPNYYLAEKIQAAHFICCIGYFTRSQLMVFSAPHHWPKLEISRLGVDPTIFTPRSHRPISDSCELLCIGRMVPEKGQWVLVQVVMKLLSQGIAVRLRLVGDGPERIPLATEVQRQHCEQAIIFEGAVNQDRILEFYQTADIFVLASFAEGIPVVLMEAMMMEIPCITTCITGIPELIQHDTEGLLIAPSDEIGLAEAILTLINDPQKRQTLGHNGRRKILQNYELKSNTEKLAQIFEKWLD